MRAIYVSAKFALSHFQSNMLETQVAYINCMIVVCRLPVYIYIRIMLNDRTKCGAYSRFFVSELLGLFSSALDKELLISMKPMIESCYNGGSSGIQVLHSSLKEVL